MTCLSFKNLESLSLVEREGACFCLQTHLCQQGSMSAVGFCLHTQLCQQGSVSRILFSRLVISLAFPACERSKAAGSAAPSLLQLLSHGWKCERSP